MEVRITCRHGDTPDDVKDYAREKLSPIGKFNRLTRSIEVVFDEDSLSKTVEIIAHLERGAPVVVHAKHEDLRAAIDLAHDKIEKVLRRQKKRVEGRRREKMEPGVGLVADSGEDAGEDFGEEE